MYMATNKEWKPLPVQPARSADSAHASTEKVSEPLHLTTIDNLAGVPTHDLADGTLAFVKSEKTAFMYRYGLYDENKSPLKDEPVPLLSRQAFGFGLWYPISGAKPEKKDTADPKGEYHRLKALDWAELMYGSPPRTWCRAWSHKPERAAAVIEYVNEYTWNWKAFAAPELGESTLHNCAPSLEMAMKAADLWLLKRAVDVLNPRCDRAAVFDDLGPLHTQLVAWVKEHLSADANPKISSFALWIGDRLLCVSTVGATPETVGALNRAISPEDLVAFCIRKAVSEMPSEGAMFRLVAQRVGDAAAWSTKHFVVLKPKSTEKTVEPKPDDNRPKTRSFLLDRTRAELMIWISARLRDTKASPPLRAFSLEARGKDGNYHLRLNRWSPTESYAGDKVEFEGYENKPAWSRFILDKVIARIEQHADPKTVHYRLNAYRGDDDTPIRVAYSHIDFEWPEPAAGPA
jgi:hypothetical protein